MDWLVEGEVNVQEVYVGGEVVGVGLKGGLYEWDEEQEEFGCPHCEGSWISG